MKNTNSNKILIAAAVISVFVALIAVVITYFSVVNLVGKISGYATATGQANLTIESSAAINFTTNSVDWGSGRVSGGYTSASLTTFETNNVTGGNWTLTTAGGLRVENIGNVNLTLNITVGKNASNFIGGTNPAYEINVSASEANSCLNATGGADGMTFTLGEFYNANTSNTIMYCDIFRFETGNDEIRIDFNLTVPENSLTGALGDVITATASTA